MEQPLENVKSGNESKLSAEDFNLKFLNKYSLYVFKHV